MSDLLVTQKLSSIPGATIDTVTQFADLTTLHLGGQPRAVVRCASTQAVIDVVSLLDAHQVPLLIIGGGSNLVIADGPVDVVAVVLECDNIHIDPDSGILRTEAGAVWDSVVAAAVDAGLGGIECLSGIPGSAGATPVQNVGAYGAEISDVLTRVRLWDRSAGEDVWVPASELDLSYRHSNLKHTSRAVVLEIELALSVDGLSAPLRFGELARTLGVSGSEGSGGSGARRPVEEVREAVLELRRGKGMVYDPSDHDTWSAGSFFTNPIVSAVLAEKVRAVATELRGADDAERMPCFDVGDEQRKLSAAWLIDRAGFTKGHPGEGAAARLSTKHTLALTNRGNATTADLVALAREVRDGVLDVFGVELVPEPVWVGVEL